MSKKNFKNVDDFASSILYEDNHLLVLNKPAGILTQEDQSGDEDLLNLAKNFIKVRDEKPGNVYLAMVHRLDRNTGGVICFAKTSKAAGRLNEQIRKHQWQKKYLSINEEHGAEPKLPGENWEYLEDDLHKDRASNKSKVRKRGKDTSQKAKAKPAALRTRIVDTKLYDDKYYYLRELDLITGRSHQIRVQLGSRNEPIVGDYKYGAEKNPALPEFFLGLWAYELEIIHPVSGERMSFRSYPDSNAPVWKFFDIEGFKASKEEEI